MKFFAYWCAVARRAASESWALIGFERSARIVVAALIYVVYVVILWNWRGAKDATGDIAGTAAGIAAPLIILPLIYIWKFGETPWRIAQEDAAQIAALERDADADEVKAPARDMTIGELFHHIRPDVLGKENGEDIWLKVGTEVKQAFIDGTVKAWGRKCATDQGWTGQSWEEIRRIFRSRPINGDGRISLINSSPRARRGIATCVGERRARTRSSTSTCASAERRPKRFGHARRKRRSAFQTECGARPSPIAPKPTPPP